jgi:hypothetical protein
VIQRTIRTLCAAAPAAFLIAGTCVAAQPAATRPISTASAPAIQDAFPRFIVPTAQPQMDQLRALFHHHYVPGNHLATGWIEWMSSSTLWPAVGDAGAGQRQVDGWRQTLESRKIDADGYVSTHQHPGQGHADGWPFPLWTQGGGVGWHFSLKEMPYREEFGVRKTTQAGFEIIGGTDGAIDADGWRIHLTEPNATLVTPGFSMPDPHGPWLKMQWSANRLDAANCYVEWTTEGDADFSPAKRVYFSPPADAAGFAYTMIPVHPHPGWKGKITRLRLGFANAGPADVHIRYLATAFDTRHNVNNSNFVQGCCNYFNWTGDVDFLRRNIQRMRTAAEYCMTTLGTRRHFCVVTPWAGHEGRTGLARTAGGKKTLLIGTGIGNNYWDLLPFGGQDALATLYVYDAITKLAEIEALAEAHPDWNLPSNTTGMTSAALRRHAADIKRSAGEKLWNDKTGRFVAAIDADGVAHDYGFTFVNLEAIHYGFATPEQANKILSWIDGRRTVPGDTSIGPDIYHWRFAPRSTTRRNVDYYTWVWSAPEDIPFGGQVQDGGAVLGFSYHDLMARLQTLGPDSAWQRLQDILAWWAETQAAGGYRAYYKDPARGTLQGGGTAGGLGLDHEFAESILVPQVMLYGFLGVRPVAGGIEIRPALPKDWPQLTVTGVRTGGRVVDITAARDKVTLTSVPGTLAGNWKIERVGAEGAVISSTVRRVLPTDPSVSVDLQRGGCVRIVPLPE